MKQQIGMYYRLQRFTWMIYLSMREDEIIEGYKFHPCKREIIHSYERSPASSHWMCGQPESSLPPLS